MSRGEKPPRTGLRAALFLGSGALFGLLVGLACSFGLAEGDEGTLRIVTVVSVLLFALLAWRYGARFWSWVLDALALLWP